MDPPRTPPGNPRGRLFGTPPQGGASKPPSPAPSRVMSVLGYFQHAAEAFPRPGWLGGKISFADAQEAARSGRALSSSQLTDAAQVALKEARSLTERLQMRDAVHALLVSAAMLERLRRALPVGPSREAEKVAQLSADLATRAQERAGDGISHAEVDAMVAAAARDLTAALQHCGAVATGDAPRHGAVLPTLRVPEAIPPRLGRTVLSYINVRLCMLRQLLSGQGAASAQALWLRATAEMEGHAHWMLRILPTSDVSANTAGYYRRSLARVYAELCISAPGPAQGADPLRKVLQLLAEQHAAERAAGAQPDRSWHGILGRAGERVYLRGYDMQHAWHATVHAALQEEARRVSAEKEKDALANPTPPRRSPSPPPSIPNNCSYFAGLRSMTPEHARCFVPAVRRHPPVAGDVRMWQILALASWDALSTYGVPLGSLRTRIESIVRSALYLRDDPVTAWALWLLKRVEDSGVRTTVHQHPLISAARLLLRYGCVSEAASWADAAAQPRPDPGAVPSATAGLLRATVEAVRAEVVLINDPEDAAAQRHLQQALGVVEAADAAAAAGGGHGELCEVLRKDASWTVRCAAASAAATAGSTEGVLQATAGVCAAFFRTQALHAEPTSQTSNSLVDLSNIFDIFTHFCNALLVRGEHAWLEPVLRQAIKTLGCSGHALSPFRVADTLRASAAQYNVQGNSQIAKGHARAALELCGALPSCAAVTELRIRLWLQAAEADLELGSRGEALAAVQAAEDELQKLHPPKLAAQLREPWATLLGDGAGWLRPMRWIDVDSEGLRAVMRRCQLLCQLQRAALCTPERAGQKRPRDDRAAESAAHGDGPDCMEVYRSAAAQRRPPEAAQARLLAALQRHPPRSRTARKQGLADAAAAAEHLRAALSCGSAGWFGGLTHSRKIVLELLQRLPSTDPALAHYVCVSAATLTFRHQREGVEQRRQGVLFRPRSSADDWTRDPQQLTASVLGALPAELCVVAVAEGPRGSLYLTRLPGGEANPVTVRLPGRAAALRACRESLREVLAAAKEHLQRQRTPGVVEDDWRRQWWDRRRDLDDRMRSVVTSIGDAALGPWRTLLLGGMLGRGYRGAVERVLTECARRLREIAPGADLDTEILRLLLAGASQLYTGAPLSEGARGTRMKPSSSVDRELELGQGLPAASVERGYWEDTALLLAQGFAELLPLTRDAFAAARPALLRTAEWAHKELATSLPAPRPNQRQHVCLVLGGWMNELPWEASSGLFEQRISRIPSVDWLLAALARRAELQAAGQRAGSIDPSKVCFILNPDGNLKDTQARFQWFLKRKGWAGNVGALEGTVVSTKSQGSTQPADAACARAWRNKWLQLWRDGVMNHDFFIYIGHGTGEQFVRLDDLRCIAYTPLERVRRLGGGAKEPVLLKRNFDEAPSVPPGEEDPAVLPPLRERAVCFLTGCSSSRMVALGTSVSVDVQGITHSYLLAGCPAVLANLWDITDGEIDRFTTRTLSHLVGGPDGPQLEPPEHIVPALDDHWTLSDAVSASRKACTLKYLVGAAPVVHGLPMRVDRPDTA
eukprot:TRINITY_DN27623_c0_g1_i1.p1 TRINITY_DN27623_c0_g1~~TRINITY_DN27623_c0_g1_i1.p1  ORF type:complete len:1549 (+),score=441.43 TRINITY_DN27623_c0_g1_i1:84-4730(+)